jgi:hypothetical protein
MAIPKGTRIIQVVTPIKGVVTDYEVDKETGEVQYKVEYEDEHGEKHQRYFKEHHFTVDDD